MADTEFIRWIIGWLGGHRDKIMDYFILLACLLLIVIIGLVIVFSSTTQAAGKRKLREQARQHYASSRGVAHLQLIKTAVDYALAERAAVEIELNIANTTYAQSERAEKKELEQVLVKSIVDMHLQEVSGIGPSSKTMLIAHVFDGSLASLHHAARLPGIGEKKQVAISQWVQSYEAKLPTLHQKDFPGKRPIQQKHARQKSMQIKQIRKLEAQKMLLDKRVSRLQQEHAWLKLVKEKDFVVLLQNPEKSSPQVDRFLQGVFAEWEPMPQWLLEALAAQNETRN